MKRTLSKRQKLALRLSLALITINTLFFILLAPTSNEAQDIKELPHDQIEIKIRGTLQTSFEKGRKITLLHTTGLKLGPATLFKEEGDSISILLEPSLYNQSYTKLIHDEWTLLPYVAQQTAGVSYEIHY